MARKDELDAASNKVASSIKLFDAGSETMTSNKINRSSSSNRPEVESLTGATGAVSIRGELSNWIK